MYIIDNCSRYCWRQEGLFDCLYFVSSIKGTNILLKVSNLNEFLYQVVQILALLCGMSMLLIIGTLSLLVSSDPISLDRL